MNTATPTETTRTVGYFNSHSHPLHVVISKYGMTLELQPGKYVEDTKGRKINDPFFDGYKLLTKETSETPVPMIRLGVPRAVENQRYDGHSVRQVTEFTHDARGVRRPVMPQRGLIPAPPENQPSVRSMSVEEARRLGLIRRTRAVPDDYGVADTDGAPPQGIPPMKLATDLPPANPASTSTGSGIRRPMAAAQAQQRQPTAPVEEAAAADDLNNLPEPELTDPLATAQVGATMQEAVAGRGPAAGTPSSVVSALPAADDEPEAEAPLVDHGPEVVEAEVEAPAAPPAKKFVCAADGKPFDTYAELAKHVKKNYRDLNTVKSLLAPYAGQKNG